MSDTTSTSVYTLAAGAISAALAPHTKFPLAHLPTPLEPLTALTEQLRKGQPAPSIWIKRDDCTGLAGGGNKTRKLEYLIAQAKAADADTIFTYGAVQSNHARQTAAACAQAGFKCELFLARQVPAPGPDYEASGNVLLDHLCGAQVHLLEPQEVKPKANERLEALSQQGRRVYQIPAGGSNATGALGYTECYAELLGQLGSANIQCDWLVHASSSAGTQAGLLAGQLIAKSVDLESVGPEEAALPQVLGVNVYHPDEQALHQRIGKLLEQLQGSLFPAATNALDHLGTTLHLDSGSLGPGYGIADTSTLTAIRLLAQTHGILLDPAYSGKAFASLLRQIKDGQYQDHETVVFVHTGGAMSLPVYHSIFAET